MFEFIRGLHNLRPQHHGCALTIGNFDGVHRGHRAVIERLRDRAKMLGVPSTVMVFEPQPQEFFAPTVAVPRLTRIRDKVAALADAGVDRVFCLRFDARQAAMSAAEFIERIVVAGLGARFVVVGDDFRFGKGRAGDIAMLRTAGAQAGFEVAAMDTFAVAGGRVSSTRIREALATGDMEAARDMLGRPYRISGHVGHGSKLGRQLGVPTINMALGRRAAALNGIFAVEVDGVVAGRRWPGAASLGVRPTVNGTRPLLEVHLLDFEGDLYGRLVNVDFLHRLRDEKKFESLDALRKAIENDIHETRAWFASRAARAPQA